MRAEEGGSGVREGKRVVGSVRESGGGRERMRQKRVGMV